MPLLQFHQQAVLRRLHIPEVLTIEPQVGIFCSTDTKRVQATSAGP